MITTLGGAKAVADVAIKVYEVAAKQGWLDKLLNIFRKQHLILVLGSTGTGKTNLLKSITEISPEAIDYMNRTEFAQTHSLKISNFPFRFVDTPGQILHSSRRIEAIRESMSRGISGVINVVADGYHEYRQGKAEAFAAEGTTRPEYLERHRAIELELLDEWTSLLGDPKTAGWLMTVVTKADLWWDRQAEVFEHYVSGPYYEALGDARTLKPVVVENCSVFHKFYGEGPLSGTFDDHDRIRSRANLLSQILAAIGKGGLNG